MITGFKKQVKCQILKISHAKLKISLKKRCDKQIPQKVMRQSTHAGQNETSEFFNIWHPPVADDDQKMDQTDSTKTGAVETSPRAARRNRASQMQASTQHSETSPAIG